MISHSETLQAGGAAPVLCLSSPIKLWLLLEVREQPEPLHGSLTATVLESLARTPGAPTPSYCEHCFVEDGKRPGFSVAELWKSPCGYPDLKAASASPPG